MLGVVGPFVSGQGLGPQQPGQRAADRRAKIEGQANFADGGLVLPGRGREQATVVMHQALEFWQTDALCGRGGRVAGDVRLTGPAKQPE